MRPRNKQEGTVTTNKKSNKVMHTSDALEIGWAPELIWVLQ
jgi:hypothetical protein